MNNMLPALLLLLVPAELPQVPAGFVVEQLHEAGADEGSWVCMDFDDHGRLVIAPESGQLLRLVPTADGFEVHRIDVPVQRAQGLLHHGDSLYCNVNAPLEQGGGLHRLRDQDDDGVFETHERLSEWEWGGEHGAHAIIPGPDGMLYLVQGNHVRPPEKVSATSAFRNWDEDVLIERVWDPRGHAVGRVSPAGHVLRIDPDGNHWELFAGGMRNAYDIAFNRDGELFAYDADMEWDIGTAWYRLPRVVHVVSGGETGWRSGSAKWSDSWPDAQPPVAETDVGSPTGICFAYETNFPEPWRSSLLLGDWSYGRILACHMTEDGAGYTGTIEPFLQGKPFNVTDLVVGPDGHLYCITGGRGTSSALYRVRWNGEAATTPPPTSDPSAASARGRRRALESLHDGTLLDSEAFDDTWSSMGDKDRSIRFAARVALERIPADAWARRALEEEDRATAVSALLALARTGTPAQRSEVLARTQAMLEASPPRQQRIDLLRISMIALSRGGTNESLSDMLIIGYPDGDFEIDRLLSTLLVYQQHPEAVRRTLDRLDETSSPAQQLHFALVLRLAKQGWNEETRDEFRAWYNRARGYEGGLSIQGFVEAIAEPVLGPREETADDGARPELPEGPLHAWTMSEIVPHLPRMDLDRSRERGAAAFTDCLCIRCHRFGGEGGSTGPDLSAIGNRFTRHDMLEAILEPSKVVSDQYAQVRITTRDGSMHVGRIVQQDDERIDILTDPYGLAATVVEVDDVVRIEAEPSSSMAPGLVNTLTVEQVLDLLAYMESGPGEE